MMPAVRVSPEFEPLEQILGEKYREFIFVEKVPLGDIWLYVYKNLKSKKYLILDGYCRAYDYSNGRYYHVNVREVLLDVFT